MSQTEQHFLPDTHQNAWDLSVIQLIGMISLPVISSSVLLIQTYNFLSAFLAVVLGNLILFFIRLGIVSMSFKKKQSALDIAKEYLGSFGGYCIAILLLLSTVAWFVVQTTLASNTLISLAPINEGDGIDSFIQYSVILGVMSTLFCMEGIVMIRWFCKIAFPILMIAFGVVFFICFPLSNVTFKGPISFSGIGLVLAISLGVTVDLPTFFRHSRSWKDSRNSLIFIQVVSLIVGIASLYLVNIITPWFGIEANNPNIFESQAVKHALIVLTVVSVIGANIANVYSASVGWELVAPVFAGRKEYLILGLGLTVIFILIANVFSLELMLEVTDAALVNLCLTLVIGYLIFLLMKKQVLFVNKIGYFSGWSLATIATTLEHLHVIHTGYSELVIGLVIIGLTALLTIYYRVVSKV